jgi:hypothetical protein
MNTSLDLYRRLIIAAHFRFRHETCKVKACRKRRRCTGGPRGTFSRLGVPACLRDDLAANGGDVTSLLATFLIEGDAGGEPNAQGARSGCRVRAKSESPAKTGEWGKGRGLPDPTVIPGARATRDPVIVP